MAIKVIPATAIALTVSFVEPGFSVWADYKVDVSYKEAVYAADWRDIGVKAAVSRPDVFQVEVINPIDQISKELIKARSDAFSVVQGTTTIDFGKNPSDSFTYVDTTALILAKLLVDTQGFTDETAFDVSKALADTPILTEQASLEPQKALSDVTTVTTAQVTKELQKVFADSVTMLDLITVVKEFIRSFSDSATLLDAYIAEFQPSESDSTAVVDQTNFAVALTKQESLLLLDDMDGDLTYAFVKSIGLSITPNDQTALTALLNKSDGSTLVSSGVLTIQDYCDITYFAEDYVGESRTFS